MLDGYRVLDLTDDRGLIAGRLLADLGADVVLVEPAGGRARRVPPLPGGGAGSLLFDALAANRRGVAVDLDCAEGQERRVRDLTAAADFLLESADPGYLGARGLGWEELRQVNPELVYVSVTAFGSSGPKAGYPASDLTVWAAGGPLEPHRDGDRPPVRISVPQAFLHAGADAARTRLLG
ncbi:CoA transferase [Frankia sp. AiPs1]|uniref:CoA transferase n=1 Tax=Frankia sp. AiPs1 TaxID=573493 RepID=UPI002043A565|nr:CoA transferase [Frankia sp. AiPs1]MCM3921805.1 CoA transferase [Frankia sp. AiPs1]